MLALPRSSSVRQLRRSNASSSSSGASASSGRAAPRSTSERVARDRLAGGDDLARRHAAVTREQRHEGLVLRRLAPAEPKRRTAVLVPERAPELRDELRVVRIAAVDLHRQRATARVARPRRRRRRRSAGRRPRGPPRRRRARAAPPRPRRARAGRPRCRTASRMPAAAATATRKPARVPLGVAGPTSSAPRTPSATIQRPAVCSGRTRCGAMVRMTATPSATGIAGNAGELDAPGISDPKAGQSPTASRVTTAAREPGEQERRRAPRRRRVRRLATTATSTSTIAQSPSRS